MQANLKFRILSVIAAITILLGIYSAKFWPSSEYGTNFQMYYTAACLVRSHLSIHIYDAVGPDTNPQGLFVDPKTVFAQTARAHGISRITLYLYPPTLADLIVPLTVLSASSALVVWNFLGVLMILGLSMALGRSLDIQSVRVPLLIAAAVLLFRPTLNTFHWGQVSILLVFLATVSLSLYIAGHKSVAALLLALAIAIKLEPIALVVPLIAWRDWKFLRNLAAWGVLLCLGLWAVNGTDALSLYFLHQLPAMSGGELGGAVYDVNRSLGNIFYVLLGGAHPIVSSRGIGWLIRALSALIICYAGWLSRSGPGETLTKRRQFEIGMIFLLLICCLSPYSWFYNWALCAPAMVMFCKRAWDGVMDTTETVFLIALLLSLATTKFNMALISPVLGVALGLIVLHRMRLELRSAEGAQIDKLKAVQAS